MKKVLGILVLLIGTLANAEERIERGKVTYVAAGTVYTSLGRESGVRDSSELFVVSNRDTVITLRVYAVSSKSSACWVVRARREALVGDDVIARIIVAGASDREDSLTRRPSPQQELTRRVPRTGRSNADDASFRVQGRVSAQYSTSLYSVSDFNLSQPGIAINLRGARHDSPFKFDIYANLRSLSLGGGNPFSGSSSNQSRIYGISLTFDDSSNHITLGRIIPTFSPSVGYVDGALLSRRIGNVTIGTALGFQPDLSLRGISTEYKKLSVFTQYVSGDRRSFSLSAAYARTYYHSSLDREAASVLMSSAINQDFYLYLNTEVDLRVKSANDFVLSPHLTSAYLSMNFRITNSFNIGLGADASRPYYSFESIRHVADSLLVNELRGGASLNVSWTLPGGIMVYNTYSPRNSSEESFGKDFSNYSSITFSDVFSTGVNCRVNANVNANYLTKGNGYGAAVQKTFGSTLDVSVRYQTNSYKVTQLDQGNRSTTVGADVMVFLTNSLTFLATFDRLNGFGVVSNSLFAELSVRF